MSGSRNGAGINPVPERMKDMAAGTVEAVVAKPREGKFNKNAARRVRVAGLIPAVVYGAGQERSRLRSIRRRSPRFCTRTRAITRSLI